jgi:hypothetical protein
MSAIAAMIVEPANNLKRWGGEDSAKLYRYADATVLFVRSGSGVTNIVQAGAAAIPWTAGFGNGDPAPTTPGTIDLNDYDLWVTFILAGANNSVQQMYVTQYRNWPAIAGAAGGRTVIPLDVVEFLTAHHAGPEFIVDQTVTLSGTYDTGGGIAVAASTDATTHGDYGFHDISFSPAFPTGVVPDVVATSGDPDFVAWVDRANTSVTPTAHGELTGVDYNGVTFDSPPLVFPSVTADPSAGEFESDYQPSVKNVSNADFTLQLDHLAPDIDPFPTLPGGSAHPPTGVTAKATTGITTTDTAAHHHGVPNADYTTGTHDTSNESPAHAHGLTEPASGAGHDHAPGTQTFYTSIFTNEVTDRVLTVAWMAQGQQHADATHVPVSWIARG